MPALKGLYPSFRFLQNFFILVSVQLFIPFLKFEIFFMVFIFYFFYLN